MQHDELTDDLLMFVNGSLGKRESSAARVDGDQHEVYGDVSDDDDGDADDDGAHVRHDNGLRSVWK